MRRAHVAMVVALLLTACKDPCPEPISSSRHAIVAEQEKLVVPKIPSDRFPTMIAIDGDTLVAGVNNDVADSRVIVFTRTAQQDWSVQQTLVIPSTQDAQFGIVGALSGDTIVVGVRAHDLPTFTEAGIVYVYVRSGTTWTLQQELTAYDPQEGAHFGGTVAIDSDTIVVGATGKELQNGGGAYVFVRSATTWAFQQKLVGVTATGFISGVKVSGDLTAVNYRQVAIRIFKRSGTTWFLEAQIGASGPIDLDGNVLVVGPTMATLDTGVQIYERQAAPAISWVNVQTLTSGQPADLADLFGTSLSLDGDRLLVGARTWTIPSPKIAGAAYLFEKGATWSEKLKLMSPGAFKGDLYGGSVGLSGNAAVIGSVGGDDVFVVRLGEPNGTPCASKDTCISNLCADGVCCAGPCAAACSVCSIAAGGTTDGICTTASTSTVCRAAAGPCDKEETCSSTVTSLDCPPDELEPDNTPCPGGGVCLAGVCSGGADDAGTDAGADLDGSAPDTTPDDASAQDTSPPDTSMADHGAIGPDASDAEESSSGGCQIGAFEVSAVPVLLALVLVLSGQCRRRRRR